MSELSYEIAISLKTSDSRVLDDTPEVAGIILRDNYFAQDLGGELYFYKDGCYRKGAHRAIHLAVVQIFEKFSGHKTKWTSARGQEVIKYIGTKAAELLPHPEVHRINLLNGIYNLKSGELEPHTPEYRTTVQLNVAYDREAVCTAWDTFINEVFPEEAGGKALGYEIVAWLMTPFTCSQKSIVLLGGGSNGKSVYIEGVTEFLGSGNISNIPLQKLSDRFTTTQLIGKLANISADLPNTKLASTSEFKNLVGGDTLLGEYKNGAIFPFKPFARCLFACNELPETPDNSDGFYRRLNIVEFTKTFKEDPLMKAKLTALLHNPAELSGLLNRAIAVHPKVCLEGITITESMTQVLENHRKENDPVSIWFDEFTAESFHDETGKLVGDEAMIPMTELYQAYRQSGGGGQSAKSSIAFGKSLKRYRKKVEKKQKRIDGVVTWVYVGIRLKSEIEGLDWQSSDEEIVEEVTIQ